MPTYEYRCGSCKKKVSVFFLSIAQAQRENPVCPLCQGTQLSRLMSRFALVRSSAKLLDGNGDMPDLGDVERGDPRALARMMRQLSDEAGEPMEPEMEGVLERLESGEDPESLGRELEAAEGGGAPDSMGASGAFDSGAGAGGSGE